MNKSPKYAYRVTFSCFNCRKSYKPAIKDFESTRACPKCKETMRNMGRKFKTPPAKDIEAWKIIEHIVLRGKWARFSIAPGEVVAFPKTMAQAEEFVAELGKQKALIERNRKQDETKWKWAALDRKKKRAAVGRARIKADSTGSAKAKSPKKKT